MNTDANANGNGDTRCKLGLVGMGFTGRHLARRMTGHGHSVLGYDKNANNLEAVRREADGKPLCAVDSLEEFVSRLVRPRVIMILQPAGPPVDSVVRDLMPHLGNNDLLIDASNSHFGDTDRRSRLLAEQDIAYLGLGLLGGEAEPLMDLSITAGGPEKAYEKVRPILESIAAQVDDRPCAAYVGPGSAGHYVKMVHTGIKLALMQLVAETYGLMKGGLGASNDDLRAIYSQWAEARSEVNGYLIEVAAQLFAAGGETTEGNLVDQPLDEAKQKGTGAWAAQDALELRVPTPTILAALSMRDLIAFQGERTAAKKLLKASSRAFDGDKDAFVEQLRSGLYAAMIITMAQGLSQLRHGSQAHEYGLDLEAVTHIWRGSVIRTGLLNDIHAAYASQPNLTNVLLDARLGGAVVDRQDDLRAIVSAATHMGIPTPAFMSSLAHFDAYRAPWLPANLIQAQQDYFAGRSYEQVDQKGVSKTHEEPDPGNGPA